MIMLVLTITDAKELGFKGKTCVAVQNVTNRSQEVIKNIAGSVSRLLNEMFGSYLGNNCENKKVKSGNSDNLNKKCKVDLTKFKIKFPSTEDKSFIRKNPRKLCAKIL
ncbi:MAG: hypothetical protein ACJA0S_000234 [Rickettsiales bacterium]|jgi:hypothetical protein